MANNVRARNEVWLASEGWYNFLTSPKESKPNLGELTEKKRTGWALLYDVHVFL